MNVAIRPTLRSSYSRGFHCMECFKPVRDSRAQRLVAHSALMVCFTCSGGTMAPAVPPTFGDSSAWTIGRDGVRTRFHGDLTGVVQGELF